MSVDYATTAAPQTTAFAMAQSSFTTECNEGQFLVLTKRSGTDALVNTVGFSIVIP